MNTQKKANNGKRESANVEFGMEFGDLNAAKMYETPFPKKKRKNK
ncbi:hypothetical protein AB1K84_22185 [Mesobacillus foraminis]|jgi:hypothetical protein|uniref:Uncharacterized protein n=1 Tax=Mesobacillus foraminis TaxID=279826 RepID=A0A4R2BKK8_9BACI|nr:hypothetical protein [Mesobacillus foraminis]TCN27731.1 hypothetical protein EV146_10158 [Mesobacillus foraminis]